MEIVRVMASPRPDDMASLVNLVGFAPRYSGGGGFDATGRLIYRTTNVRMNAEGGISPWMTPPDTTRPAAYYDSTPILRVGMVTRTVDTIGFLTTPPTAVPCACERCDGERDCDVYKVNPITHLTTTGPSSPTVRSRSCERATYHIEWVNADGTRGA